jgi:hypothetical protein
VDYVLQQGSIRHELRQLAVETDAEAIVMGRPRRDSGHNVFRASEFKTFIAELDLGGDLHTIQVTPSGSEWLTAFLPFDVSEKVAVGNF